jgi:tetratricopeptide (TPR) repeat protein
MTDARNGGQRHWASWVTNLEPDADTASEEDLSEQVRRRFDEALMTGPQYYAAVLAAAEWQEAAGVPISPALLFAQAARQMSALLSGRALTPTEFTGVLSWATAAPAVLCPAGAGDFELAEALRWWPLAGARRRPDAAESLSELTPLAAVIAGKWAWYAANPDRELARRAWEGVISRDDPDAAALARWYLAEADREDGAMEAARTAFEQIIAEGHFAVAPRALVSLAELDLETSPELAEQHLRRAMASGHRLASLEAARRLRALCLARADESGALEAARLGYDPRDPLWGAADGLVLAALLVRAGETESAEQVLAEVSSCDNPLYSGLAAAELSRLLLARADLTAAERVLTDALAAGEIMYRADLYVALAGVMAARDDFVAAEELLDEAQRAIIPPQPPERARAMLLRAHMAIARTDDDTAARLFTEMFSHPDAQVRAAADQLACQLGALQRRSGPWAIPGIAPLLHHLMTQPHSPVRQWAAYGIGALAERAGDPRQACQAYRAALDGEDTDYTVRAARKLAATTTDPAELTRALEALAEIIEHGPAEHVARAMAAADQLAPPSAPPSSETHGE